MITLMFGNNEKRYTKPVNENESPARIFGAAELVFADTGLELNGVRLTKEQAYQPLKELGVDNNSILMYNKKNDNG